MTRKVAVRTTLLRSRDGTSHPTSHRKRFKQEFDEEFDVQRADAWSLVYLYELCAGRHLFPQDLNDDSMAPDEDEMRLCLWSCIDDES